MKNLETVKSHFLELHKEPLIRKAPRIDYFIKTGSPSYEIDILVMDCLLSFAFRLLARGVSWRRDSVNQEEVIGSLKGIWKNSFDEILVFSNNKMIEGALLECSTRLDDDECNYFSITGGEVQNLVLSISGTEIALEGAILDIQDRSIEWGGIDYIRFEKAEIPDQENLEYNPSLIGMWWDWDYVFGYEYTADGDVSLYICNTSGPCNPRWTKKWHSDGTSIYSYVIHDDLPFIQSYTQYYVNFANDESVYINSKLYYKE